MSAPQFTTMFDLSGFQGIPSALKIQYQDNWNTYNRIQLSNFAVSTIRATGNRDTVYTPFVSYEEKNSFTVGQLLHIKRYPNSNWAPVPQD